MKIAKDDNPNFKVLCSIARPDAIRNYGSVIYADPTTKMAIASDGFQLFGTRDLSAMIGANYGKTYRIEPFATTKTLVESGVKFPNWNNLVPDHAPRTVLEMDVPKYFKKLHNSDVTSVINMEGPIPDIYLGPSRNFIPKNKNTIAFNAKCLSHFAGTRIHIGVWAHNEMFAILPHDYKSGDKVIIQEWFLLCVPLNAIEPEKVTPILRRA